MEDDIRARGGNKQYGIKFVDKNKYIILRNCSPAKNKCTERKLGKK